MATGTGRSANRVVGAVFGVLWVLSGVVVLGASRHVPFTDAHGALLLGQFSVNGLRGVVMLVVGAALLAAAAAGQRPARVVNLVVGAAWLAMDVFALLVHESSVNVLAIREHDPDVLLVAALALLTTALVLDQPRTRGTGSKYRTVPDVLERP